MIVADLSDLHVGLFPQVYRVHFYAKKYPSISGRKDQIGGSKDPNFVKRICILVLYLDIFKMDLDQNCNLFSKKILPRRICNFLYLDHFLDQI